MQLEISKPFWQVVGLGVLAGMRTTSAPAIASHILSHHNSGHLAKSSLDFMQSDNIAIAMKVFAVGELIADKLPFTPNRIKPVSVITRCVSGSLAGASIYKAVGKNALQGAALGTVAALGSTFGSYFLRKSTVNKLKIFDPFIGAIEDALVIGAGVGLNQLS
ncbi:MAG: putative rane protein [Mucilaginibacter sp.]|jgi:uncharacterized membrane protein|nr:putative rane protein [Mucilaginibacter sp.]